MCWRSVLQQQQVPRHLVLAITSLSTRQGLTRHRSLSFWTESSMLENSGSIARDILATERTFLAWARTGLGFVGAGTALFAAYHRQTEGETLQYDIVPACALLMANGGFLLMFATRRYLTITKALQQDKFPLDTRGTIQAVVSTAVSTTISLGMIAHAEMKSEQRLRETAAENQNEKES